MSWLDSLKKIKKTLSGSANVHEDAQPESVLATCTIQQLEEHFSNNTFDRKVLDDLLSELKRREEEYKRAGKNISPGTYKLRFVVFERIQELSKTDSTENEQKRSTASMDSADESDEEKTEESSDKEDNKQSIPEGVAKEVVDAAVVIVSEKVTGNQAAHPSELFTGTQFKQTSREEEQLEIRIGLDFGTAFTKVVLGTSLGARAVPLAGNFHNSHDYLLPGILSVERNGDCHLGVTKGCEQVDDLKMKIIDSDGDLQLKSQVQVAAYLALLFRRIRWWWIDQQGAPEVFRNHRIAWVINSGLPTESMVGAIPSLYRRLIMAAWAASVDEGAINTNKIKETCELAMLDKAIVTHDDENQKKYLESDALELLPEFIAQTAVYISHDTIETRRLHVMVDIGAGTIDMTIFNVYDWQGTIRHAIYGKKVVPYGVNYLIKNRLSRLEKDPALANRFYMEDISDQRFADKVGVRRERLADADRVFLDQVVTQFSSLRNRVRNDPDVSQDTDLLEKGIKLFLAGGGARIDAYKERIRKFARDSRFGGDTNTVEIGQLPNIGQVEDLERQFVAPGLDTNDYDRLSVAYGLSDDPWNLAELLDEEQVAQINIRRRNRDRPTIGDTGGAFWDDPNAPPVW